MGSPFLELFFGYGVKVKVTSEVKGQIGPKISKQSPLDVVHCLPISECQGLLGWISRYMNV